MKLMLLTPEGGSEIIDCDRVDLVACDNEKGEGGGSVGVRKNHIEAVVALEDGSPVRAWLDGREVYSAAVPGGFAMVRDNTVTVLTDSRNKEN